MDCIEKSLRPMRPLDNPYIAGAGSPPPFLAGRDDVLAAVELMLGRAHVGRPFRGPLLLGLRGAGKSVLLARFETLAQDAGFVAASREIIPDRTEPFRDTMTLLARRAIFALAHQTPLADDGTRLLRVLASFASNSTTTEGASANLEVQALPGVADSGVLGDDLADLLVALGEVLAAHDTGVLFLLDEIHNLGRDDMAALIHALHRTSAKALPVAVAAAGLPQTFNPSAETQTQFERLFETWTLGPLEDAAARQALTRPAADVDVTWDVDVLGVAVANSRAWPYFLQEWGQQLWAATDVPPVGMDALDQAVGAVQASLDRAFFAPRYERATEAERSYLAAMATLESPCDTASVAAVLGATQQAMSVRRDGLIRRGLIYSPKLGQVAFAAPFFNEFLARRDLVDKSGPKGTKNRVDTNAPAPKVTERAPHIAPLATTPVAAAPTVPTTDSAGLSPKDQVA